MAAKAFFDSKGMHTTKYGNRYTQEEWTAQQDCYKAEKVIAAQFAPKYAAYEKRLRERLAEIGLSEKATAMVAAHWYEIEDMEEMGRIAFSSPERRAAVVELLKKYGKAYDELHCAEEGALSDAKEAALSKVR